MLAMLNSLLKVLLVLGVVACGQNEAQESSPSKALRILPTNASAVDYVVSLVGTERLAAIPNTVDDYANVDGLDQLGSDRRFDEFSAEVLLSFSPDLIVASPWQGKDTIARVREAGVRVVELGSIKTLDDIRSTLFELGAELHAEARAEEIVAGFDQRVAALQAAAKLREPIVAVSYTNYGSGGWTAGTGTTADLVMGLAGIQNRAAMAGRSGNDALDVETFLTWDPDWIVVSTPSGAYGATKAYLEGEDALQHLVSLQAGRIAEVPSALYSTTSHYLLDAAEALIAAIEAHGE